jgi:redox-sensitive bicupin YhaK (pirin superfamily)
VRRGGVLVQGEALKLADVAIMNQDGTTLTLEASEDDTSVLILSGEPINEPIAARGPFVMNTQEELKQAWMDFQYRQNGF